MNNTLGWIGLAALGLCGACASQDKAPATSADASAASVEAATNNPNTQPNFAPARADGTASAIQTPDRGTPPGTNPAPGTTDTVADNDRSMTSSARNARTTTTTPGSTSTTSNGATQGDTNAGYAGTATTATSASDRTDATAPDNTRVNKRDQNDAKLVPTDQGNNEADLKTTQEIRQALVKDKTLSFGAKNVKIITVNGKVTLRGPVSSAAERATIEAAARKVAGATQVDSQLEVKTDNK